MKKFKTEDMPMPLRETRLKFDVWGYLRDCLNDTANEIHRDMLRYLSTETVVESTAHVVKQRGIVGPRERWVSYDQANHD